MSNIPRDEVLRRLCKVASSVGEAFEHQYASDCFCEDRGLKMLNPLFHALGSDFRFEEEVMKFIEEAVQEKLKTLAKT